MSLIRQLLDLVADPNSRTTVDDFTTPLEEAESSGHDQVAEILRRVTNRSQ